MVSCAVSGPAVKVSTSPEISSAIEARFTVFPPSIRGGSGRIVPGRGGLRGRYKIAALTLPETAGVSPRLGRTNTIPDREPVSWPRTGGDNDDPAGIGARASRATSKDRMSDRLRGPRLEATTPFRLQVCKKGEQMAGTKAVSHVTIAADSFCKIGPPEDRGLGGLSCAFPLSFVLGIAAASSRAGDLARVAARSPSRPPRPAMGVLEDARRIVAEQMETFEDIVAEARARRASRRRRGDGVARCEWSKMSPRNPSAGSGATALRERQRPAPRVVVRR